MDAIDFEQVNYEKAERQRVWWIYASEVLGRWREIIHVQVLVVNGCNEVFVFSGCVRLPFCLSFALSVHYCVCARYRINNNAIKNPLRLYNNGQLQLS